MARIRSRGIASRAPCCRTDSEAPRGSRWIVAPCVSALPGACDRAKGKLTSRPSLLISGLGLAALRYCAIAPKHRNADAFFSPAFWRYGELRGDLFEGAGSYPGPPTSRNSPPRRLQDHSDPSDADKAAGVAAADSASLSMLTPTPITCANPETSRSLAVLENSSRSTLDAAKNRMNSTATVVKKLPTTPPAPPERQTFHEVPCPLGK